MNAADIHDFYFESATNKPKPFAVVQVACPYCHAHFYLEADEAGAIRTARHSCTRQTWTVIE